MKGVNWALLKSAHVLLRNKFLDGLGFEERLESWVANSLGISQNWNLACFHLACFQYHELNDSLATACGLRLAFDLIAEGFSK